MDENKILEALSELKKENEALKEKINIIENKTVNTEVSIKNTEVLNNTDKTEEIKKESFELNIGIRWFKTIGIIALVVGIGYFIKYAIDNNLINYITRIILAYLLGASLLIIGHIFKQKEKFKLWAETIMGGGIAIFFTMTFMLYSVFAFRNFLKIELTTEIMLLILVSIFSVIISLFENSQNLACWSYGLSFITISINRSPWGNYTDFKFIYLSFISLSSIIIGSIKKWYYLDFVGLSGSYWFSLFIFVKTLMLYKIFLLLIFLFSNIKSFSRLYQNENDLLKQQNNVLIGVNAGFFMLASYIHKLFNPFYMFIFYLSIGYCLLAIIHYYFKKKIQPLYVSLFVIFFVFFSLLKIDKTLISVIWSLLLLFLSLIYLYSKEEIFKICAQFLLIVLFFKIILFDHFFLQNIHFKYLYYFIYFICFYIASYIFETISKEKTNVFYWLSFIIGLFSIHTLVASNWLSISWLIYAIITLIFGFVINKKIFRLQGLTAILFVVFKIVFIDSISLPVIYKTALFIILGVLLLISSFIYIKYQNKLKDIF